jgi:GT2 family glycosyltransferase
MSSLTVQMVLYRNPIPQIRRALNSIVNSAGCAADEFKIRLGSNSCNSSSNVEYAKLVKEFSKHIDIGLVNSDTNIGHGAMHNFLFHEESSFSDLLLIMNPDGILGLNSLQAMFKKISSSTVGAVEPRQIPFEHPKKYNLLTGETNWISGACILVKSEIFKKVGFFDERFFLHGDDVDLSWRIRNDGFTIHCVAEATYFHDKQVGTSGYPKLSESENFYGPLGALLIAHKYGLKKGLKVMLKDLSKSDNEVHRDVLKAFQLQSSFCEPIKIKPGIAKYNHPWRFSENRY